MIIWGKHNYFWKCGECGTNMPIKEYCPKCRAKMKFRKTGPRFNRYCEPCKIEELYYRIPPGRAGA